MNKNDARVRYTQHVLKESFLKLLKKKPVNKITVKEVCELSGLNRSTFYSHYSDCFALMEAIEDELLYDFEKALAGIKDYNFDDLIAGIYAMIDRNEGACRALILK
ncbi:MAG: TetR/AcrR family transcriptional regulator, partial [Lachnospiraceae bacterium]|nr:TetR/AcrR family transcriptional regulator [Lachnospiraceae bacterium]